MKSTLPREVEPLLMPGEVAKIFRVDRETVYRWNDDGTLAAVRTPGGHRRFPLSEVRRLHRTGRPS